MDNWLISQSTLGDLVETLVLIKKNFFLIFDSVYDSEKKSCAWSWVLLLSRHSPLGDKGCDMVLLHVSDKVQWDLASWFQSPPPSSEETGQVTWHVWTSYSEPVNRQSGFLSKISPIWTVHANLIYVTNDETIFRHVCDHFHMTGFCYWGFCSQAKGNSPWGMCIPPFSS